MRYWIVLFLFCLGIGPAVQAQNKGVVKGRVFDLASNEAIPFANVVVYGTTLGGATDEEGRFRLENVPPGLVRLEVSSIGYQTLVTVGFLLGTAGERTENIGLEPASTTLEQVVVKASPYRKTVETPVSIQRIGIAEIEKNPGGNRDISKVVQSMPGVLSSPAFRNDFVVRGGGPAENRFYLDGVELPILNHFATQGASGGVVSIVNIDFVKEVNFFSGAFPASYEFYARISTDRGKSRPGEDAGYFRCYRLRPVFGRSVGSKDYFYCFGPAKLSEDVVRYHRFAFSSGV